MAKFSNKQKFQFLKHWFLADGKTVDIADAYLKKFKGAPNTGLMGALRRAREAGKLEEMVDSSTVRAAFPPGSTPPRGKKQRRGMPELEILDPPPPAATLVPKVLTSNNDGHALSTDLKKSLKILGELLRENDIQTLTLDVTSPETQYSLVARPVVRMHGPL